MSLVVKREPLDIQIGTQSGVALRRSRTHAHPSHAHTFTTVQNIAARRGRTADARPGRALRTTSTSREFPRIRIGAVSELKTYLTKLG